MFRQLLIVSSLLTICNCIADDSGNLTAPGDTIHWGGASFKCRQLPLENKLKEFEKQKEAFVFKGDFSNPRGYVASWRIVGRSLCLEAVEGQLIDDKIAVLAVVNEDSLPCKAVWFSGLLYLPIGEFDFEKQQWPMAVKIRISKGTVLETEFLKNVKDFGPFAGDEEIPVKAP